MSSWSEKPPRAHVLRGGAAQLARPARMDAELRTSPYADAGVVDARLTDPHLQAVVDRARRAAMEQGRAAGHVAGYAAGAARAVVEAEERRQQAEQVEQQLEAERARRAAAALEVLAEAARAFAEREATAVAEVEDVIGDLALQIARAVLDRELALSAAPGREAVARALQLAPATAHAVLRLHPDDLATLGDLTEIAAGRTFTVVADPVVEQGGCVVDAAGRRIDAQVGAALDRVAAVLR